MPCGCQELSQIRAAAESLKAEVDYLKDARETSRQQQEVLALRELRRTVEALHAERDTIRQQAAAVRCATQKYTLLLMSGAECNMSFACAPLQVEVAFEELSGDVRAQLTAEQEQKLEAHVSQVLEAVDLEKVMDGAAGCQCMQCPFIQHARHTSISSGLHSS